MTTSYYQCETEDGMPAHMYQEVRVHVHQDCDTAGALHALACTLYRVTSDKRVSDAEIAALVRPYIVQGKSLHMVGPNGADCAIHAWVVPGQEGLVMVDTHKYVGPPILGLFLVAGIYGNYCSQQGRS